MTVRGVVIDAASDVVAIESRQVCFDRMPGTARGARLERELASQARIGPGLYAGRQIEEGRKLRERHGASAEGAPRPPLEQDRGKLADGLWRRQPEQWTADALRRGWQ